MQKMGKSLKNNHSSITHTNQMLSIMFLPDVYWEDQRATLKSYLNEEIATTPVIMHKQLVPGW